MNLPFKVEIVDTQHLNFPRSSRYGASNNAEISIDIRLHSREVERLDDLRPSIREHLIRQVIEESKRRANDEFIYFLQIAAQPVNYFPLEAFERHWSQKYSLLMSTRCAQDVLELCGLTHLNNESIIIYGYELEVHEHSRLVDSEAYLVASDRYVLFLYPSAGAHGVEIYRSDFIERNQRTLQPINLHSQIVIDAIQQALSSPRRRRRRIMPLFDIIPRNPSRDDQPTSKPITECPKCGGKVKRLGGNDYICLDCDWDNLKTIC